MINNRYTLFTTETSIILYPKTDEQYTCEVQHPGLIKPLHATFVMNILNQPGTPIIQGYRKGDIVKVGDILTLTCISKNGNPPPQVIWLRNNVEVDKSYTVTSKKDVINTYTFTVTGADNQMLFKCLVNSNVTSKSLETSVQLNVQCKYKPF